MLINLLDQEARGSRMRVIAMAALSGVAQALVLALANTAAVSHGVTSGFVFAGFVAAVVVFLIGLRQSVGTLSGTLETVVSKLRIEVAEHVRQAELLGLEQLGPTEIYDRLTVQASIISSAAWPLAVGAQAAVVVLCTVLYLSMISSQMLVLALAVYGLGAVYYAGRQAYIERVLNSATHTRLRLFERLKDFLDGFKEVRLRTQRSDEIQAEFQQLTKTLGEQMIQSHVLEQQNYTFGTMVQFVLLGAAAFVLPQFVESTAHVTLANISALVFLLTPLGQVIYAYPEYTKADLAAQNIVSIRERLRAAAANATTAASSSAFSAHPFRELQLRNLEFQRVDSQGQPIFSVGPVNLTVRAGEITFLVGGNGSGKTTLMRAMTALYAPTAGMLSVNGTPIDDRNRQGYRELIAAVFADFHLFRKLYGLSDVAGDKVQALLEAMQLETKTQLVDREWKMLDLSTGQRKRMAMIVALLEDRPIYVFDEWAADQDPEYRHYFYEVLLRDLKRRGKAVIAISHDDRYFRCADQVVTLEYGKVRSIESHT